MAKQQVRQVSIFINGKAVENTLKSIAAEQRKLTNELANTVRGTVEYERKAAELTKVNGILREHRQAVSGIKQGWDLTKIGVQNFVGIAAGAFAADTVISYGKELFNTAVKMEALEKKARIVFGETLPAINEAAKKNATQMGLTSTQYVQAAAAIQDILVPMGFQRKQAAEITTQLVNLSGALSEWTGGQVSATQVSEILAAALTGERERLKQLGIVLQQSDIDARLAEKGLSGLTGQLRQQAEAATSLELILEKSQDAQASYAENAGSMTRETAELTARFEEMKENLSTSLIPVFERLIDIIGGVGEALDWVAGKAEDPAWQKWAKALSPLFAVLFEVSGKGDRKTKSVLESELEEAKQLVEDTDALLAKYGVKKEKQGVFDPNAGKPKSDAEKKRAAELARQQKEDEEAIARTATQIQRAKELQTTLTAFLEKEEQKRLAASIARGEAEFENYVANKEQQKLVDINYEQEKAAVEEELRLFLQSDKEAEIEALQNHYATLLLMAEQYGLDTAALKKKQADDLAAIEKKYAEEEAQRQFEFQQARLAALASMFGEFGNLVSSTFDLLAGEGEKSAEFQKIATLAKIAFDTASAISSLVAASEANPANAFTFGAAAVAQYVAGIARIITNIGQAKKILSGAPKVQQKYAGGYLSVTGADDGRQYNASVIPTPYTGLLPPHPVLFQSAATGAPVLASERGQEYFVSSESLRNPYVANLTRMIDSITLAGGRGVRQFAEGGANTSAGASPIEGGKGGEQLAMMRELAQSINTLNALLARGIIAVVPDGTVIDIDKRFKKINAASGGYFG